MDDWFLSDERIERLFGQLRERARETAAAAVNQAAETAEDSLPSLGAALRTELDATISLARMRASETVDAEKAHAIRVLAEVVPGLRTEINRIAREAGLSASGGALDEAQRRSSGLSRAAVAVAGAALFVGLAAVVGAAIARQQAPGVSR